MGKAKVWERRWSERKKKFYYVNTETRISLWKQPPDFVEVHFLIFTLLVFVLRCCNLS